MRWTRATSGAGRRRAALAAVALLLATRAHATASPPAQRVIDRYVTATGGRAAFDAERTLHQRGRVSAFGLNGTAEMWRARPDRERTVAHLGPVTITQGVDGARAWQHVSGNALQWADGKDLDALLGETWFEAERWCEAGHGGGDIQIAPAAAPRLAGGETLQITPPRGAARLVQFNAAGLVEIARERRDQLSLVYESRDYRLAAGRVRPHREAQRVIELPANDTEVEILLSEANVPMHDTLFAPGAGQQERTPAFADGVHAVRVPVALRESLPCVRVALNGLPPVWFLVDSGSTLSCIDSVYAAGLGLRGTGTVQVQGVGAQAAIHLVEVDSLALADSAGSRFTVRATHLAMINLAGDLGATGADHLVGILGGDVLGRSVFTLDYDDASLVLEDAPYFTPPPAADSVGITLGSGVPVVRATLDGTDTGLFRLDTGSANGVDLHGAFVEQHGIAARAPCVVVAEAVGLGGAVTLRYFRAQSLTVGRSRLAFPVASMSAATTGAFTSEDYAGNIGTQVLQRFRCTFDYTRRVVYLTPSAAFDEEVRAGALRLRPEREGWRVLEAAAGRRALRPGDLVAEIEGDAICVLSAPQLMSRLAEASSHDPLRLGVRRGRGAKRLHLPYPAPR